MARKKFAIKQGPAGLLGAASLIRRQGSGLNNAAARAFIASHGAGGGGGSAPPPSLFSANAVHFNGSDAWLARGADLTGIADSKTGIFSCWVNRASDGSTHYLFSSFSSVVGTAQVQVLVGNDNKLTVFLRNDSAGLILNIASDVDVLAADDWVHLLMSWDLGTPEVHIYIADVEAAASPATLTDDTIDYTGTEWGVGTSAAGLGTVLFDGDVAEMYFQAGEFLDFTVEANRRLFGSAGGKPVDLGADGSTPTGTQPLAFFSGDTADWHTNKGSGGGFTETGALTDAATSPSD